MNTSNRKTSDGSVSLTLTGAEAEILDRLFHMCFSTIFEEKTSRHKPTSIVVLKEDKEIDTLWEIWRRLQVKIMETGAH